MTIVISASVPLFDYSQLNLETKIKVQQLETEIDEGHAEVQVLMTQTLDKMWGVGEKYSRVQTLLEAHKLSFKSWFLSRYGNEAMLRKAYKCMRIYTDLSRDNLSLVADYGKSFVYSLTAKNMPQAARDEIIERLQAGETLSSEDLTSIIENHTIVITPWLLPGVEPLEQETKESGIETFQHLTHGGASDNHITEASKMVAPAVTRTPKFTPGIINKPEVAPPAPVKTQARRCIHCNNEQQIEMSGLHTCGKCYKTERFDKWLDSPKSESPTVSAAPIAPPPPPPVAKPISELAKVDYDDDEAEGDDEEEEEVSEPVELKAAPIPPPPPAAAMPLPPPPPPLVARAQIDIAVEFSKLSETKKFEVASAILSQLDKMHLSQLLIFINHKLKGEE